MQRLKRLIGEHASLRQFGLRLYGDLRGQDMIEYALMAGAVALASAAVLPSATSSISTVFSKVSSVLTVAASS
jgi:pilus assembly protein Flp/PilA